MAVDFRYTHEYGVSMVNVKQVDVNFDSITQMETQTKLKSEAADMKSKFEAALQGHNPSSSQTTDMKSKFDVTLQGHNPSLSQTGDMKSKFEAALQGSHPSSGAVDMKSKFEVAMRGHNASPLLSSIDQRKLNKDHLQSVTPSPRVQFEQNLMKSMVTANQSFAAAGNAQSYGSNTGIGGDRLVQERERVGDRNMNIGQRSHDRKSGVVDASRVSTLMRKQSAEVMHKAATKIQV